MVSVEADFNRARPRAQGSNFIRGASVHNQMTFMPTMRQELERFQQVWNNYRVRKMKSGDREIPSHVPAVAFQEQARLMPPPYVGMDDDGEEYDARGPRYARNVHGPEMPPLDRIRLLSGPGPASGAGHCVVRLDWTG